MLPSPESGKLRLASIFASLLVAPGDDAPAGPDQGASHELRALREEIVALRRDVANGGMRE